MYMKKYIVHVALIFTAMIFLYSCEKELESDQLFLTDPSASALKSTGHLQQTKTFSSEVAFKWMNMQLRLDRLNPTSLGGTPSHRYFCYGAVAM
jgi:hypothetical protein